VLIGLLAAGPFLHVVSVLAKQQFLGFGETSFASYVLHVGVGPVLAGLLLARHWNTRFGLYLFFAYQIWRGFRFESALLAGLSVVGILYLQRATMKRIYPEVDFPRMIRFLRSGPAADERASADLPKLRQGILGGLLGGLVFAAIMLVNRTLNDLGMMALPLIGSLVGQPSPWIGFVVHMLNSAVIGALYVLLFRRIEKGMVDGLHYGMMYGGVWWFVGPLTLMPLLLGMEVGSQWTLANVLRTFPSLIGHLVYGAILGMTVGAFRDRSLPVEVVAPKPTAPAPARAPREVRVREEVAEAPEAAPAAAFGAAPLWLTTGAITIVFLLNVIVFGYALTHGLPRAEMAATAVQEAPEAPAATSVPAAVPATASPDSAAPAAATPSEGAGESK
jgi:hypothetical protein